MSETAVTTEKKKETYSAREVNPNGRERATGKKEAEQVGAG
jgi:hypothetical protein